MDSLIIGGSRDLVRFGSSPEQTPGRKCPVCGKRFKAGRGWVYHVGSTYFCRWNCQVAWEKAHPDKAHKVSSTTGSWYVQYSEIWKDSEEGCEARVRLCHKKIRNFRENFEYFREKGDGRLSRNSELAMLRWEKKLAEAQEELARWQRKEVGPWADGRT